MDSDAMSSDPTTGRVRGPLASVRVVEIEGLGAAPFAAMALADLGAEVVRVVRPDKVRVQVANRQQSETNN